MTWDDPPSREEGEKEAAESELPVTPLADVPEAMTGLPIFIEEMEGLVDWRGPSEEQRAFARDWTIYPETELTSPLVRVE